MKFIAFLTISSIVPDDIFFLSFKNLSHAGSQKPITMHGIWSQRVNCVGTENKHKIVVT